MGSKMALSKSTRIKIMIAIDTVFFLIELISGFLAHSLALTADAFHMLNDIISLIIGLWAVTAAQKETTDEFTFGWVRAEILGAFFNAVFLIALCVSIVLEALTRFVEPPEIKNPKLILAVGCAGLVSNLAGFLVLGGHGHSHGPGGHDHGDEEQGHSHAHSHSHDTEPPIFYRDEVADEEGNIGDVLPETIVARAADGRRIRFHDDPAAEDADVEANFRSSKRNSAHSARGRDSRRSSKMSGHGRFASLDDMSIHPSSFRQDIIAAGLNTNPIPSESDTEDDLIGFESAVDATEDSPLVSNNKDSSNGAPQTQPSPLRLKRRSRRDSSVHDGHNHTLPKQPGKKGGHDHGDMGMNAMILHVIGDALGNVGVIATALIIWLTEWPGKEYADPAISLFITAIILNTSIPLTRATSRILLQATPENISISEIRQDIERLPGVVSCHHVHVWQLSDTKVVASMHLQVSFPLNTNSGAKYMQLAKRARKCLHGYGIHSATIQPEFCLDPQQLQGEASELTLDGATDMASSTDAACLLECIDDCRAEGCCTADSASKASSIRRASDSEADGGHSHSHQH